MEYLGFEVSRKGIRTSSEKVKFVLDWPRPQSMQDIRLFLGLASYYQKFIWGFLQIAKPLIDVTRDKIVWQWGEKGEQSFLALKAMMATVPILRSPDFKPQFVDMTDGTDMAIGAILEHGFRSRLQPIAF